MKKSITLLIILLFLLKTIAMAQATDCSTSERVLLNTKPWQLTEIDALKMIQGKKGTVFTGDSTKNISLSTFPPLKKTRHYSQKISFIRSPEILDSEWRVVPYLMYEDNPSIDGYLITTWVLCFLLGMIGKYLLEFISPFSSVWQKPLQYLIAGTICSILFGSIAAGLYGSSLIDGQFSGIHYISIISISYIGYVISFEYETGFIKSVIKTKIFIIFLYLPKFRTK